MKKSSTLAQQIKDAQKEIGKWSESHRFAFNISVNHRDANINSQSINKVNSPNTVKDKSY